MDIEEFEKHKKALAAKRLEKPKKLSAQASKYWTEISTESYNFDRGEHLNCFFKVLHQKSNSFRSSRSPRSGEDHERRVSKILRGKSLTFQLFSVNVNEVFVGIDRIECTETEKAERLRIFDTSEGKSRLGYGWAGKGSWRWRLDSGGNRLHIRGRFLELEVLRF